MKVKIKAFIILLPIMEVIAFLLAFCSQILYEIKLNSEVVFDKRLTEMIRHPLQTIMQCIGARNPFIIILPIGMLVLLIFAFTRKPKRHGEIDETSGIYGNANWEKPENLTRENMRKQKKFSICSKRSFMDNFLESIDEK